jgi:hypothetical protein
MNDHHINFVYDTQYNSSYCCRNRKTNKTTIGLNCNQFDSITPFDIISIAHELGHYYSMEEGNWYYNVSTKKMRYLTYSILDDKCDLITDKDIFYFCFYLKELITEEEFAWKKAKILFYKLGIRDFEEFQKVQLYALNSYNELITKCLKKIDHIN